MFLRISWMILRYPFYTLRHPETLKDGSIASAALSVYYLRLLRVLVWYFGPQIKRRLIGIFVGTGQPLWLPLIVIVAVWVSLAQFGSGTYSFWNWSASAWQAVGAGVTGVALVSIAFLNLSLQRSNQNPPLFVYQSPADSLEGVAFEADASLDWHIGIINQSTNPVIMEQFRVHSSAYMEIKVSVGKTDELDKRLLEESDRILFKPGDHYKFVCKVHLFQHEYPRRFSRSREALKGRLTFQWMPMDCNIIYWNGDRRRHQRIIREIDPLPDLQWEALSSSIFEMPPSE